MSIARGIECRYVMIKKHRLGYRGESLLVGRKKKRRGTGIESMV